MKKIIFTDLDGTLLNHNDYSFEESKEALKKVLHQNIPLVFVTSKTKIEVEMLQKRIGIKEPFIIENGAAIFIPRTYKAYDFSFLDEFENYYILQLGLTYKQILTFYNRYKKAFTMLGFSDMSENDIIKYTKLTVENVRLSKQRDFTEPFILKDESVLPNLQNLAATFNIKITKGGRFYHLIGEKQDKGKAVKKCINLFSNVCNKKIESIALGDGENDTTMLENVKTPIIIKNYKGKYISLKNTKAQKSSFKGSKGWNEMVLKNV